MMDEGYQFDDDLGDLTQPLVTEPAPSAPMNHQPTRPANPKGNGHFSEELFSKTIHARQRTFYIDLKESSNGKFIKVSEKSRGGRKTTIMMDAEDVAEFITALQEIQNHL
ncbi:DUF3276 family protein [Candidatus Peregrinibacteria bacterium]|nr:MAG: DUF3276 family protein [Candidatus Peregrinibacteria bacterium]